MKHWRTTLPENSILDVPYEELVEGQEAWSRKMLAFIGLPWDPRCLDFHLTNRTGHHREQMAGAPENQPIIRRPLAKL